ncbi:hypothetical protein LWM68_06835 [Niabella sp. W65]|nr:hypothetical protein [Niabella sp. W65]MCH7362510.1 hypothetical protein [Niabella sp. W65]
MLKGLEIRKNNLEGKLKGVVKDIEEKKDAGINFRDMGLITSLWMNPISIKISRLQPVTTGLQA